VVRREIGFSGLLMTDDLSMKALAGSLGERARAAIAAGCDVALHCNGDLAEMHAVACDCGHLAGPALARAEAALASARPPRELDRTTSRPGWASFWPVLFDSNVGMPDEPLWGHKAAIKWMDRESSSPRLDGEQELMRPHDGSSEVWPDGEGPLRRETERPTASS
jgi:hypothetical protein